MKIAAVDKLPSPFQFLYDDHKDDITSEKKTLVFPTITFYISTSFFW